VADILGLYTSPVAFSVEPWNQLTVEPSVAGAIKPTTPCPQREAEPTLNAGTGLTVAVTAVLEELVQLLYVAFT